MLEGYLDETEDGPERGAGYLDEIMIPGTDADIVGEYHGYAKLAKTAEFGLFEDEVIVLDTETTGFSPESDRLIEISAARVRGNKVIDRYDTFVNPGRHIPEEITELTSIDDAMVADAPDAITAVSGLAEFVGGTDIVAHNASFDRSFIMRWAADDEIRGEWIDSLDLARIALPRLRSHTLGDLSRAFGAHSSSHRASDDVDALVGIWRVILVGLDHLPPGLLNFIRDLRPSTPWPARKVISALAAKNPDSRFSLRVHRDRKVAAVRQPAKVDANECVGDYPTMRQVEESFAPGGVVERMYPRFERRDEQVVMADGVEEAFSTASMRVIEAGTGTGKSIAYLVPAALTARKLGIGVGVATKTNALLDQLVYHELPALDAALPDGVRYVALKGYDHYPCLHKLARFASMDEEPEERYRESARNEMVAIAMLYAFVAQSTYCDLDSVNIYWRSFSRGHVAATSAECLHRHCPFFPNACMIHGLRQRARSADIVVTNHALLFRDAVSDGGILPPIRHWIIDEAHSAEDEARKQLSPHIAAPDLFLRLSSLYRGRSSVCGAVRSVAAKVAGGTLLLAKAALLEEEAKLTEALATSFFSFVKELDGGERTGGYEYRDLWIDGQVRDSGAWGPVRSTGTSLRDHIGRLEAACRELGVLFDEEGASQVEVKSEVSAAAGILAGMREALTLMLDGSDEAYVYSATICRNPDRQLEDLKSELLDVGQTLVNEFFSRMTSVVFTSATLSTGDSFAYFEKSIGLDRFDGDRHLAPIQLESSYDYDAQMRVLVPTDVPEPNQHGYLDALAGLIEGVHEAAGGGTLTLFTNRRDMEELYYLLGPRLERKGLPLICQLKGRSAKRLQDEFIRQENMSLFALKSFWEGFDAPGSTLRCVIITRLPFSRPDEPISRERERRDPKAWAHYTLPEAILSLKQAAGRLIRASTDRGYLVICDSRLVTKRYGRAFLKALPSRDQHLLETEALCREILPG